jgi:hypothetical protein
VPTRPARRGGGGHDRAKPDRPGRRRPADRQVGPSKRDGDRPDGEGGYGRTEHGEHAPGAAAAGRPVIGVCSGQTIMVGGWREVEQLGPEELRTRCVVPIGRDLGALRIERSVCAEKDRQRCRWTPQRRRSSPGRRSAQSKTGHGLP